MADDSTKLISFGIIYALASNDETIDHLETLYETKSLASMETYQKLLDKANLLGKNSISSSKPYNETTKV